MNALMTIQVRVMSAQALAQLRAIQAQERATTMGAANMNKGLAGGIPMLSKWGNQVQWAGRQLMYNFTLPIAAAMGYATKWALENEAGMVRVSKVYGDASMSAGQVRREVEALGGAFEALSSIYGVQQSEVLNIAGDWAAAGASGLALAKITKLTLETMVLGEQDAATATKNLIAIQAQYGMNTAELTKTIDILNMTENQTGTTLKDLMDGMARSAGVAKTAGVSVRELAAMMAALTPVTGSAASAGNGLKTIISRLLSPTSDAASVMRLMGVETNKAAWASLNGTQRLEAMADAYKNLSGQQKVQVAKTVASQYQINRFTTLMDAFNEKNSYYWKSLRSTNDRQELFAQRQRELNAVLESSPQKLKQVGVILQNSMANVIVPLIPAITLLAQWVAKLGHAFQNLSGDTQKFVLVSLLVLAAIGPIARYVGAVANLFGLLGSATQFFVRMGMMPLVLALKLVASPFRLAGALAMAFFKLLSGAGLSATRSVAREQQTQTRWVVTGAQTRTKAVETAAAAQTAVVGSSQAAQTEYLRYGVAYREGLSMRETAQRMVLLAELTEAQVATSGAEGVMSSAAAAGSAERIAATQSEMATRLIAVDSLGVARVQGEYASQAAQTAAVSTNALARITEERAEQATRTFTVDGAGSARVAAETFEQVQRTFIADSNGTIRAAYEQAEQASRTLALNAGSTARVAAEAAAEGERVFIVSSAGTARVVAEQAAEVQRVIAVTAAGQARVTSEAAAQAGMNAIMAGSYGTRLALESGEQAQRTFIVTGGGVARQQMSAAEEAARLFEVTAGGEARVVAEEVANTARIQAMILALSAMTGYETAAAAERLFAQEGYTASSTALIEAYYAYMIETLLAYNASVRGIESAGYTARLALAAGFQAEMLAIEGSAYARNAAAYAASLGVRAELTAAASASLLALEAGTWATRDALAVGGSASLLAIESGGAAARASVNAAGNAAVVTSAGVSSGLVVGFWASARTRLVGIFTSFVLFLPRLLMGMVAAFTSPIGIAVISVLAIVYVMRDKIKQTFEDIKGSLGNFGSAIGKIFAPVVPFFNRIVQGISDAFWALPDSITGALIRVVTVIRDAALQVYEWFSYLNPFAHHSPSLVEQVTKGMDVVTAQYRRAAGVGSIFAKAASDLAKFKKMIPQGNEFADDRKDVKKVNPGALPAFDNLVKTLNKLRGIEKAQEEAVNRQQAVVDKWSKKLETANAALDKQQSKLDRLKDKLNDLQTRYDNAAQAMSDYASAPIEGMGAMNDAIFENEMAQKRLQLQMANWEATNGSIDDTRDNLAKLRGDIELLTGQASDLRMAGAGSDVLGPINGQIAAMKAQADALNGAVAGAPVSQMQSQLDDLKKQGEMLQLQYDVNYDPLTHSIQKLANTQKELSYDEIVKGINDQRAAMDALAPQIDAQSAKVAAQQAVVDQYTATRDKLNQSYSDEQAHLDALNDRYQKTKDLVSDISSALNDMQSSAVKASGVDEALKGKKPKAMTDIEKQFAAGGMGGDFAKIGGSSAIERLTKGEETDDITEWAKNQNDKLAQSLGGMDMFGPIKDKWNQAWGWVKKNIGPIASDIGDGIKNAFGSIDVGDPFAKLEKVKDSSFVKDMQSVGNNVRGIIGDIIDAVGKIAKFFLPDLEDLGNAFIRFKNRIRDEIFPIIEDMKPAFKDLGKAIGNAWQIAKPPLMLLVGFFTVTLKLAFSIATNLIENLLNFVFGILKNAIQIIGGILKIFVGIFTLNFGMIKDGVLDILGGMWGLIWTLFKNAVGTVWGIIKAFGEVIIDAFNWIKDVLVGHSIVPDMINAIIDCFHWLADIATWVWDNVLKPVVNFFQRAWDDVKAGLGLWWAGVKATWDGLKKAGQWVWDNVLKPVYDFFVQAWSWVKDELGKWWDRVKAVWAALGNAGTWIKNNMFDPVVNKVKAAWTDVSAELGDWWRRIKEAWNGLVNGADWVKRNLMDPVFNAFVDGWNAVKKWFGDNADTILSPIKSVVRGIVGAINWLIKGLNAVGKLPGINISISEINLPEKFEVGGEMTRRANRGFRTNGARAIVGEGKANYPEYVIPTDPTHRARAKMLLGQAAGRVGVDVVPQHASGGILGDIKDKMVNTAKKGWDKLKDLGRDAVGVAAKPFLSGAHKAVDLLPTYVLENVDVPRTTGNATIDKVEAYINGAQKVYQGIYDDKKAAAAKAAASMGGATTYVPDPANPTKLTTWKGGTFTNRFVAHMIAAEKKAGASVGVIQGGFRPATSYSGTSHQGDAIDMPVNYALLKAFRSVGIAAGDRTGLGDWAPHIHAVPGPGAGSAAGSAVWQFQDYMAKGGAGQSATSPWGLANGAIIRHSQGGSNVTIGEGKYDEAVTPLPRGWQQTVFGNNDSDTKASVSISIENVSFPNITDPNDAETLLENLKNLAKD